MQPEHRVLHRFQDHVLGEHSRVPVAFGDEIQERSLEVDQSRLGPSLDLETWIRHPEIGEPMQEHLEVACFVDHLGRHEYLRVVVGCKLHQTTRALECGRLTDAVVAERRDQALTTIVTEFDGGRRVGSAKRPIRQVALDRVEPELERKNLVQEVLFRKFMWVELVNRVGVHHTGAVGAWSSMPTRVSRVLNSSRTVPASTFCICSGVAVARSVPWKSAPTPPSSC